jgi:hypothetical protein
MSDIDARWALNAAAAVRIAPLDPLGADAQLARLPDWNEQADVSSLVAAVRRLVSNKGEVTAMSPFAACAAMRDLGMFLCSLKRHGVEPVVAVPEVEPVLIELGRMTGMVPRDTVYHYGPWNPIGARERCFTRDSNERSLIHCVRSAAPGLESAIGLLLDARASEFAGAVFAEQCLRAARSVAVMVDSINHARQKVDVLFFAKVLRPYFEPITVGGESFMGPAAAHLPLAVVDHFTWGSDCGDPTYAMFRHDASVYTVPALQRLWRETSGESLTTRVVRALAESEDAEPGLFGAAASVYSILRVLLTFRGRHKVLADKAYDPKVRLYPVGSGGFSTDSVARVLELTREQAARLQSQIDAMLHREASLRAEGKRREESLRPVRGHSGYPPARAANGALGHGSHHLARLSATKRHVLDPASGELLSEYEADLGVGQRISVSLPAAVDAGSAREIAVQLRELAGAIESAADVAVAEAVARAELLIHGEQLYKEAENVTDANAATALLETFRGYHEAVLEYLRSQADASDALA